MGFNPQNAINNLFYRTQWINLDRYGRDGRSPITGLGDYPLKNWFHLSLPASYIFANAGAVTTLTGTLVWVISHFFWLEHAGVVWLLFIIIVLLLSTTAYAMAFARQNYQILGWMWYPAAALFYEYRQLCSRILHLVCRWFIWHNAYLFCDTYSH